MNIIRVTVETPDDILAVGAYGAGAIVRLQSGAAEAGPFANESTAPVVSGTRIYTMYDSDGTSATWYQTRYENAGGTILSDWSTAFQVGGPGLELLVDVKQRLFGTATVSNAEEETLLDIIDETLSALEHATGRWLWPRPLSGTATYRIHTQRGASLWLPRGIRSITTLGIASTDQPASGGTYTTQTAGTYYLDPSEFERETDWPATAIRFTSGGGGYFHDASYGAEIVGAFGFAAIPGDLRGVAIEAVTRRYIGKETAAPAIAVGPAGGVRLLASLSPDARAIVESYRVRPV